MGDREMQLPSSHRSVGGHRVVRLFTAAFSFRCPKIVFALDTVFCASAVWWENLVYETGSAAVGNGG